jgi:hypothetical protein
MKLLFMHMSKCGGRSFYEFLSSNYGTWANWSDGIELSSEGFVTINELPLIFGHIKYENAKKFKDHKIITVLRDPLERTISEYNHLMTQNVDFFGVRMMKEGNYSFMDFVKSIHKMIIGWVNFYTAHLFDPETRPVSEDEFISVGRATLKKFDFVGIYENMAETVNIMKVKYGLVGDLPVIGKTTKKNKIAKLTDEERVEAKKHLRMEYEIYEFGRELFKKDFLKYAGGAI